MRKVRILFAAPDRDLLACYEKLLRERGEVVTAFDGTRVISLFSSRPFDLLILDKNTPRISFRDLIERAKRDGIPTLLLTDEAPDPLPAAAVLQYPFLPEDLEQTVCALTEGAAPR